MVYDEHVWAMFGSISGDTTHTALRVTLKAETPLVNSASTDPTILETGIPWYFTDLQDDRVQGYTLARHNLHRTGAEARRDPACERPATGVSGCSSSMTPPVALDIPVVIEQKFISGDTDFRHQLQVIEDSGVDAIVLWTDIRPTAMILKQMQEFGMKQRVFGSRRCPASAARRGAQNAKPS